MQQYIDYIPRSAVIQAQRPVRLLLNAHLIRRVDDVIASGAGGFSTREELIEEALNSYLLELQEVERLSAEASVQMPPTVDPQKGPPHHRGQTLTTKVVARISSPPPAFAAEGDEILVEDVPLLGLHNRDWPSLWALSRLAHAAAAGPVSFPGYLEAVTAEAWQLAASLHEQLGADAKAATKMLPTNVLKKQAADTGFQNFAVGALSNKPLRQGLRKATGPLPAWRAIAFFISDGNVRAALTAQGWRLLQIVEGLDPRQPHDPQVAGEFFEYLRTNAPADWWGFKTVLREVSIAPTRDSLLASMESAREWSPSIASSATQGYIARCREWGLVEPKLVSGTYLLTEFGKETLHSV
ncbi:ribbon-helix-helix domain-containing protein [Sinomonas soli]